MFERSPRASHTLFSLSFPSCLLFSPSVSLFFQIDKTNPDLPFPQILSARTFPQHSLQSLPVPTSFFMLDKMNQPESTKKIEGDSTQEPAGTCARSNLTPDSLSCLGRRVELKKSVFGRTGQCTPPPLELMFSVSLFQLHSVKKEITRKFHTYPGCWEWPLVSQVWLKAQNVIKIITLFFINV